MSGLLIRCARLHWQRSIGAPIVRGACNAMLEMSAHARPEHYKLSHVLFSPHPQPIGSLRDQLVRVLLLAGKACMLADVRMTLQGTSRDDLRVLPWARSPDAPYATNLIS